MQWDYWIGGGSRIDFCVFFKSPSAQSFPRQVAVTASCAFLKLQFLLQTHFPVCVVQSNHLFFF